MMRFEVAEKKVERRADQCEESFAVISCDPYISVSVGCDLDEGHEGPHHHVFAGRLARNTVDKEDGQLDSDDPGEKVAVTWIRVVDRRR